MADVAAIILAAGRSTRFTGRAGAATKRVATLDGKPLVRHIAEANTADTELAQVTAGASVNGVATTNAHGRRVAGKLLQAAACLFASLVGSGPVHGGLLQFKALRRVARAYALARAVLFNLAIRRPC